MTFFKWSQVAATNGTADSTCPFPEGMNPATVNDGARGMMAAAAKYRDDVGGMIVTGGTATAYTVSSFQGFDTLAHLDGKEIAFTPHVTNGANGTSLNVDGLGVKPILPAPGVGLPVGVLVQGTPYIVLYNNTDGAFYLKGYFNSPFSIPLGSGVTHWGSTAPNSHFAFAAGQAISRTTYASLFSLIGTIYGPGDGATTFSLPDVRGRVVAGCDDMGGGATGRLPGYSLSAAGGEWSHTLLKAEMPAHFHGASIADPGHHHSVVAADPAPLVLGYGGGPNNGTQNSTARNTADSFTGIRINSANGLDTTDTQGSNAPHNNVQPTIAANYIIRIL